MVNLPIVTPGGLTKSRGRENLVILLQYAIVPNVKTIRSGLHLESFKNKVKDRSIRAAGGIQCMYTIDGYAISFNIRNGLPYMQLCISNGDQSTN